MSEDLEDENIAIDDQNFESAPQGDLEDFEQGGLLLKIATNGLSIPDYVKKLKEADILVAVDGEIYRDGPTKLKELFTRQNGQQSKWLLSLWRDGQILTSSSPTQLKVGLVYQPSKRPNGQLKNITSMFMAILTHIKIMRFIRMGMEFVTSSAWTKIF